MNKLRTGPWNLSELKEVSPNGLKVFSCFHCGGGSTMGYKLAGFEVLGGVEIDPEMMKVYYANHKPKHSYLMGVQDFNKISNDQLPAELFDLDILDGSPPCSTFSTAGLREKAWGEEKHFREGQAKQVLDDLFFHFIDTAEKLKPKVVVAENVKGLVMGKAKGYVKQIFNKFNECGYDAQLFLLNSAFMGVPQRRERTFFVARRKNTNFKKLELNFTEKPPALSSVFAGSEIIGKQKFSPKRFADSKVSMNQPILTITTMGRFFLDDETQLNDKTIIRCQSFPDDYNFINQESKYMCGMSVPPFMMQRVSNQIAHQWFGKEELKNG